MNKKAPSQKYGSLKYRVRILKRWKKRELAIAENHLDRIHETENVYIVDSTRMYRTQATTTNPVNLEDYR